MGLPAHADPARAVPILDVEAIFARLPPSRRSQVQWARTPIKAGLQRLRSEPLTDDLVDEVARTFVEPLVVIAQELLRAMGEDLEVYRAVMTTDLEAIEGRLVAFLPTEESRDTLAWVMGFLQSWMHAAAMRVAPGALARVAAQGLPQDTERSPSFRAMVALMAANDEAREGGAPAKADDLIDYAFLEFEVFRHDLRAEGITLSPFPRENEEQRRVRVKTAAGWLRAASTPEDDRALERARLHNLR